MTLKYPGHVLKTRQQALAQAGVLMLVLLPLLAWRITLERPVVAITLTALTLVPFAIAYRGWRLLVRQEQLHAEPTPELMFVFETVAVVPLALSAFLLILLVEM